MAAARIKVATDIGVEHKNRFFRFTPTISAGHLVTAASVIVVGTVAWTQLRIEVARLTDENVARKIEITKAVEKSDEDRSKLYQKIASDHAETMADIVQSRTQAHDDLKEFQAGFVQRFDRIEDKLDKKADKR